MTHMHAETMYGQHGCLDRTKNRLVRISGPSDWAEIRLIRNSKPDKIGTGGPNIHDAQGSRDKDGGPFNFRPLRN